MGPETATNYGLYQEQLQVVVAGSNSYNVQNMNTIVRYTRTYLNNAATDALASVNNARCVQPLGTLHMLRTLVTLRALRYIPSRAATLTRTPPTRSSTAMDVASVALVTLESAILPQAHRA